MAKIKTAAWRKKGTQSPESRKRAAKMLRLLRKRLSRAVKSAKAGKCGLAKIERNSAHRLVDWHAFAKTRRLASANFDRVNLQLHRICGW